MRDFKYVSIGALLTLLAMCLDYSRAAASPLPTLILQRGHSQQVNAVALSPDGLVLASGSEDKSVKLWEVATGHLLATLRGKLAEVTALAFSPDGRLLAASDYSDTLHLWDLAGDQRPRDIPAPGGVSSLAFSPDGRLLAGSSTSGVKVTLWDTTGGQQVRVMQRSGDNTEDLVVTCIAFSPDGATLASGGKVGHLSTWDVASGKPRGDMSAGVRGESHDRGGNANDVSSVTFVQGGKVLAVGCANMYLELSPVDGTVARRIRLNEFSASYRIAVSPDGSTLAATIPNEGKARGGERWDIELWSIANGVRLRKLAGHIEGVNAIAFSSDGRMLASGGRDAVASIWDTATTRELTRCGGHTAAATYVAFNPDANRPFMVTGHADARAIVWDLNAGRLARVLTGHSDMISALAFSPDGAVLASAGGRDGMVRLWDAVTGERRGAIRAWSGMFPMAAHGVGAMGFRPGDVTTLVTGNWNEVKRWVLPIGKRMKVVKEDQDVYGMAWRPDGRLVATGGPGQSVTLRDATLSNTSSIKLNEEEVVNGLAFSTDGRVLAGAVSALDSDTRPAHNSGLRLWDASRKTEIRTLDVDQTPLCVAFSAKGLLAAGGQVGGAWLWDASSGTRLATLQGHGDDVKSVAFTPDGRILATASADSAIRLWNASGQLLATVLALDNGKDWLAVSPEGFFDGTPGGWQKVLWRVGGGLLETAEPEQFFKEFYHPGLLADVAREGRPIPQILEDRKDPRAHLTIAEKDRRLPVVTVRPLGKGGRQVEVRVHLEEAPAYGRYSTPCGVHDVRLFRNDILVEHWGDLNGQRDLTKTVTLEAGPNRLYAYAFNDADVKSKDSNPVVVQGDARSRHGEGWIVAVGINRYAHPALNLQFAALDARDIAAALRQSLPLGGVHLTTLLDAKATRAGILAELRRLVKLAQPEDTVVIAYSGHGTLTDGHFYLVPHDLDPARNVKGQGISDEDLEAVLLPLQAKHVALILDACHSGQALEADDWRRGPVNAHGLIQLAWEKGIDVLAASQSQQAALEAWQVGNTRIGHGLLTYSLLCGLPRQRNLPVTLGHGGSAVSTRFSPAPLDGHLLMARRWLDYAANLVPQLMASGKVRGRDLVLRARGPRPVQVPRVFHRREGGRDWPVAQVGGR